jgi:hypothetical protein
MDTMSMVLADSASPMGMMPMPSHFSATSLGLGTPFFGGNLKLQYLLSLKGIWQEDWGEVCWGDEPHGQGAGGFRQPLGHGVHHLTTLCPLVHNFKTQSLVIKLSPWYHEQCEVNCKIKESMKQQ